MNEGVDKIQTISGTEDLNDLLQRANRNIDGAKSFMSKLHKSAEENKKQYLGKFIPDSDYQETDEKIIINHTFLAVETIVPIVSRRTPEANVFVFPRKPQNRQKKEKLENYLRDLWEIEIQMQKEIEKAVRQGLIHRFAAFKIFYDTENDRIDSRLIPSKRITIPETEDFEDLPFVAELVDITYGEAVERYELDTETQNKLKAALKEGENGVDEVVDSTSFKMTEYWEDNIVLWKFKDIPLGSGKNPYYDFKDDSKKNHFKSPQKPYLFFSFLTTGDSAVDETTFIEQTHTAQRVLNLRSTQVNRALEENDQIIETYGLPANQAYQLMNKGMKIIAHTDPQGFVRRVPTNIDTVSFQRDQQYLTGYMDQLFGTLPTIRGEQDTKETATGRSILRESALTRQEIIHRNIEYMAQNWYNYAIQLIKMFYEEPKEIYSLPESVNEWEEDYSISSEDLEDVVVKVLVKSGSTIPVDRVTKRAELFDLFSAGAISGKDLLIELGYASANRMSRNAFLAQTDPAALFDESSYDPVAITHILEILNGEREDGLDDLLEADDIEAMMDHIETQQKWLQGIEISEELPDVAEVPQEQKDMVVMHQRAELRKLKGLQDLAQQDIQQTPLENPNVQSVPLM